LCRLADRPGREARLTTANAAGPSSAYNPHGSDAIHQLLRLEPKFREWWLAALPRFIGTDGELPWREIPRSVISKE